MCGTSGCVNDKMVCIGRDLVGLNRLYDVFEEKYKAGKKPENLSGEELLEAIRFYNYVPPGSEQAYKEALLKEYQIYCQEKRENLELNIYP